MRLKGKVAIVTGAASGIGRAIACLLADEGGKVVVADIDDGGGQETAAEIQAGGGEALFIHADVAEEKQVKRMVATTKRKFGAIHVLVNNAAWMSGFASVTETSTKDWDYAIAVDLKGPWLCAKYCVPHMIEAGGGSIINISSVGGLVGFGGHAAYCTAKGGLIQLTRELAIDYGQYNIRANAICPGWIRTPSQVDLLKDEEWVKQVLETHTVLNRLGEPKEIAYAALFLASDESSYITGTTLAVDGGWTVR